MPVFKTGAINHSATSPNRINEIARITLGSHRIVTALLPKSHRFRDRPQQAQPATRDQVLSMSGSTSRDCRRKDGFEAIIGLQQNFIHLVRFGAAGPPKSISQPRLGRALFPDSSTG